MSESEETNNYRAEIAQRNRRRVLDGRAHKISMAVFGLMAYSAFANFVGGVVALGSSPADAGLGLILGSLYSLGVYRVWAKDDTRWWPVALPAVISIVVLLLAWFGGAPRPVPLLLNVVLLVLVPVRKRAVASAEAVSNSSSKPTPLSGAA